MLNSKGVEILLKQDKVVVFSGIAGVTFLAWLYMFRMAMGMSESGMDMTKPCMMAWDAWELVLMFIMWSIMMIAMMLPSATPMVLIFSTVNRQRSETESPLIPTGVFVLGYLAAWTAFSALATLAQWGLHEAALLSHTMVISNSFLGGILLLTSGVFQWTPFRDACMARCRSPLGFLLTDWREGNRGALIMGLKHGVYCVGCCWMLMTLSFVLGVMNLLWMAILTAFMLLEKVIPWSRWVSRLSGLALAVWGLWVVAGGIR
jgi:predicted metal-binding membrane protein